MQKNIAILTMSLDIGGAETHVYELARALADKGNNVTVFSAGGAYSAKLESIGIKHIYAPLNTKKPADLAMAYKILSKYVKENKTCIIHSHSRLSNYTAFKVAKKYKVPFVTTIHGSYTTGFFQRILTHWGDRALAVSDDLKEYAALNYGFDRDKIRVTVNGINLDTFKQNRLPELKAEIGFEPSSKIILCVTRLDDDADTHLYKIFAFAKDIYKRNPNSHILVIGGGQNANKLRGIAKKVNSDTADGFIRMLDPQTDIHRYCNIADLFIGISRAALEAIACKVPTILFGKPGYIGVYSDSVKDLCIDTNFTCRGCDFPSDGEIVNQIIDILDNPKKYEYSVQAGYELVKTRYSVVKMADDALKTYREAQRDMRPYDAMICGYYGRHNFGDDVSLEAITDNLKRSCDVKRIALITANAKYTSHNNIDKFIYRFNIWKILKYLKKTRVFILGGGSILQDATSSRSILYYLFVSKCALKSGCHIMLYSNGIGPIRSEIHRRMAAELIEKAAAVTLRDEKSLVYLRSLGVKNENILVSADETFCIQKEIKATMAPIVQDEKYICINLRQSKTTSYDFVKSFSAAIDIIYEKYKYVPVLLPMHYEQDMPVLKQLSKELKCNHVLIKDELTHDKTLEILVGCEFTIVERLHAAIFSCIFNKPFLTINYDPKILSFCIEMGMEDYIIDIASNTTYAIITQVYMLMEHFDEIKNNLKTHVQKKRELASLNENTAKYILD